jgi:hypothetical protein
MSHELGKNWSSFLFDANNIKLDADPLGNFDLNNMTPQGDAAGCKHGSANITGRATATQTPLAAFAVEFDQTSPEAHFKGFALRRAGGGDSNLIVGQVIFPITDALRKIMDIDKRKKLTGGQIEATWVATQP